MRKTCLLLAILAFTASGFADEEKKIYKYTDENGITHYTETPPDENYKEADLPPLSIVPSRKVTTTTTNSDETIDDDSATEVKVFELLEPVNEQNIWGSGGKVTGRASALSDAQKSIHQIQFVIDGKKQAPSDESTQVFEGIFRGEHKIKALLINKFSKKTIQETDTVIFYMHQNSKK